MIEIVNNSFLIPNLGFCYYVSINGQRISEDINPYEEEAQIDICTNYRTDWELEQCLDVIKDNSVLSIENCAQTSALHYYSYLYEPVQFHVKEENWRKYTLVNYNSTIYPLQLRCYSQIGEVRMPFDEQEHSFSCKNYELSNARLDIFADNFKVTNETDNAVNDLIKLLEYTCDSFSHESIQYCAVVYYDGKVINGLAYEKM